MPTEAMLSGRADARFLACLPFVLRWEGGLADVKGDKGGLTNRGVTQATYAAWRASHGRAGGSVRDATVEETEAIYHELYWLAAGCNKWTAPLDLVMFDSWVQHRPKTAARFLQRAVGAAADGVIGPLTVKAVQAANPRRTAERICYQREVFYRHLAAQPDQHKFLKGWMNRLAALGQEVQPRVVTVTMGS